MISVHENEVAELEKMWSVISDIRLCKMTPEGFAALVSPPMPSKLVSGMFRLESVLLIIDLFNKYVFRLLQRIR
jgi:hypothetical protein